MLRNSNIPLTKTSILIQILYKYYGNIIDIMCWDRHRENGQKVRRAWEEHTKAKK